MPKPETDLSAAFRRLSESLRQLAVRLNELSTAMGEPLYRRHGRPFGPSTEARRIWIRYRQFTTLN